MCRDRRSPTQSEVDGETDAQKGDVATRFDGINVVAILAIVEQIPDSLLRLSSADFGDFIWCIASLERLVKMLYHLLLERHAGAPRIAFWGQNSGTRPAKDALVTIAATGALALIVPKRRNSEEGESLALPRPPRAPRGTWVIQDPFKMLHGVFKSPPALAGLYNTGSTFPEILRAPELPDPNAFYYKRRPETAVSEVNLECRQLRHGLEREEFVLELDFDRSQAGTVEGALEFRIRAENLSGIERLVLPVRITIREVAAHEAAEGLVQQLTRRSVLSALAEKQDRAK